MADKDNYFDAMQISDFNSLKTTNWEIKAIHLSNGNKEILSNNAPGYRIEVVFVS